MSFSLSRSMYIIILKVYFLMIFFFTENFCLLKIFKKVTQNLLFSKNFQFQPKK